MSDDPNPPKPPVARVAPTEHDALPAGTRFGEFEIIRVLGVGGFGIVYLAQDHSLERQVALKEYMPAALAARGVGAMVTVRASSFAETYAVGLRSFVKEARLLARFDHPSLVKVYRFWEDNGTAYMVMPYLPGRTLRDARRAMTGPPDEAWIRGVLAPLLDVLELLHREGVFHRDIAPDNILLPSEGAPILLDFGAARRVINDRTQSLTAILKPSYAPIEQYAEMAAMRQGPWTDIYALGAVLHYLLFGVPPAPATARAVQPDAQPIEQRVVPGVSPRFVSVVAWMLGVRPLERPQNIASLRAALAGEVPIPPSVRHDVTVPGETALMPVASASVSALASASASALAYSAETRLDTAHQPTALIKPPAASPVNPPAAAAVAPPAYAPGAAPMRSTPPGTPPPAYVPPPRAPRLAPTPASASASAELPLDARKPPRRGRVVAGLLAAAAVAVGVLWQFVGVINGQHPVVAPLAAASAATSAGLVAQPASPGTHAGPTVVQAASVTQWGAGLTEPAVVVPVAASGGSATKLADAYAATASAGNHARQKPIGLRVNELAADMQSAPAADAARSRAAAVRKAPNASPKRTGPVAFSGPTTAREACADRRFIAFAVCVDRECERPRFRETAECQRVLEVKRRRAER